MFGPETLLLFDIDGTLLGGMPPAHRQAICEAAVRLFDVPLNGTELLCGYFWMSCPRISPPVLFEV